MRTPDPDPPVIHEIVQVAPRLSRQVARLAKVETQRLRVAQEGHAHSSFPLSRVRTVERDSDSPSAPRAHKEEHGDGHGRNGKPPHRHTDGRLIPLTSKAPPQRVREHAQGVRGAAWTQRGHAPWASVVPRGQR